MAVAARARRESGRRRDARKARVRTVKSLLGMLFADGAEGLNKAVKEVEQPAAASLADKVVCGERVAVRCGGR